MISRHAFRNDGADVDEYDIKGMVNRILTKFHLPSNKIIVLQSPQVNNANAALNNGVPCILYSKYFVESVKRKSNGDWRLLGITLVIIAKQLPVVLVFKTLVVVK